MKCYVNRNITQEMQLESYAHITSNCKYWRNTLMVTRHNAVARNVYFELCNIAGLKQTHYRDTIDPVKENENFTLYWDCSLNLITIVKHNRPDIVLIDKSKNTAYVCEISVSWALGEHGLAKQQKRKTNRTI